MYDWFWISLLVAAVLAGYAYDNDAKGFATTVVVLFFASIGVTYFYRLDFVLSEIIVFGGALSLCALPDILSSLSSSSSQSLSSDVRRAVMGSNVVAIHAHEQLARGPNGVTEESINSKFRLDGVMLIFYSPNDFPRDRSQWNVSKLELLMLSKIFDNNMLLFELDDSSFRANSPDGPTIITSEQYRTLSGQRNR